MGVVADKVAPGQYFFFSECISFPLSVVSLCAYVAVVHFTVL